jgi:signal transduction histidine kinase
LKKLSDGNLFSYNLKKIFIKPVKKVLIDLEVFCLINLVLIYCLLFITHDTTVAMLGVIWVAIIAWRGGVYAGVLGCVLIYISNFAAINIPPHKNIPIQYYFDNRIPGFIIGVSQCLVTGLIVGYISTLFHKLREEISLREKIQKDLEQNIAELDAFGHTVAHDLKNPLTVVYMSISSLINDFECSNDVKTKKKLSFINDGTKNMINIIESILLLAGIKKIDQNKFNVFSISKSVEAALKRLDYNIRINDVKIVKPDKWPSVFGFAPWITEVWVNYISNAIKYGGSPVMNIKPVIELGYDKPEINRAAKSEYIRFWVKDNGEGIAGDKVATLFKEFTRLHTNEQEGYGLGLSIVKSIIEKCSGAVGVENNVEKGSLFFFTLPTKMSQKTDV